MGWKAPGGMKYRAAYAANKKRNKVIRSIGRVSWRLASASLSLLPRARNSPPLPLLILFFLVIFAKMELGGEVMGGQCRGGALPKYWIFRGWEASSSPAVAEIRIKEFRGKSASNTPGPALPGFPPNKGPEIGRPSDLQRWKLRPVHNNRNSKIIELKLRLVWNWYLKTKNEEWCLASSTLTNTMGTNTNINIIDFITNHFWW